MAQEGTSRRERDQRCDSKSFWLVCVRDIKRGWIVRGILWTELLFSISSYSLLSNVSAQRPSVGRDGGDTFTSRPIKKSSLITVCLNASLYCILSLKSILISLFMSKA